MKAQWESGHKFAEVAEVLGVSTDMIVAEMPGKNESVVLFTPDEDTREVWQANMRRDEDGILREHGRTLIPGFLDKLEASIEGQLPE